MPRLPSDLPPGPRITDYLAVSLIAKSFPERSVRIALSKTGKMSTREREFPNHMVVYFVILLAFYARSSYDAVLELLLQGFQAVFRNVKSINTLAKSALTQGRVRVGWEPLAELFNSSVTPIAKKETKGAWYAGFRTVVMDGTTFDCTDSVENAKAFGYPSGGEGKGAFPQVRAVFLAESGTHVVFGAAMGSAGMSELALADQLIPKLKRGQLLLCDRLYPGFDLLTKVRKAGAEVLWRVKADTRLDVLEELRDGSFLSTFHGYSDRRRKAGLPVRVIRYRFSGGKQEYRLITSLLDPQIADAEELAALYHERWEIENTNDEIKVHLKPPKVPLRSKKPDLVLQEIYALLLAHFIVRDKMHDAALASNDDPDALSYTHAVEVIRTKLPAPGNFSP